MLSPRGDFEDDDVFRTGRCSSRAWPSRDPAVYAAAKIAIVLASLIAGALGIVILWTAPETDDESETAARAG